MVNLMKKVKEYSVVFINAMKNKINNNRVLKFIWLAFLVVTPYIGMSCLGLDTMSDVEVDFVGDQVVDKGLDKGTEKLKHHPILGNKKNILAIRFLLLLILTGIYIYLNSGICKGFLVIIKSLLDVTIISLILTLFDAFGNEDKITIRTYEKVIKPSKRVRRIRIQNIKMKRDCMIKIISFIVHVGIPIIIYGYLLTGKSVIGMLMVGFITLFVTTISSFKEKRTIINAANISQSDEKAYIHSFFPLANEVVGVKVSTKIFLGNILGMVLVYKHGLIEIAIHSWEPNTIIVIPHFSACLEAYGIIFGILMLPVVLYVGRDLGALIALWRYKKLREYLWKFMIYRFLFGLAGMSSVMIPVSMVLMNMYQNSNDSSALLGLLLIGCSILTFAISLQLFLILLMKVVECEKEVKGIAFKEYVKELNGKVNRVNRYQNVKC